MMPISRATLPGTVQNLTAARPHGITDALAAAELRCWAETRRTRDLATPSAPSLRGR